jgi:hypothetical protein
LVAQVSARGARSARGRLRVEMGARWAGLTTELGCRVYGEVLIDACSASHNGLVEEARCAICGTGGALVVSIAELVSFGTGLAQKGRPIEDRSPVASREALL